MCDGASILRTDEAQVFIAMENPARLMGQSLPKHA